MLSRPTVLRFTTLCSLHKAWQCAFPIERDTCTYTPCTCAPRRVFCFASLCMYHASGQHRKKNAACPRPHSLHACMHSLYSAVQYRRSGSGGRGHNGGIRPWHAHVHPPFRYITTAYYALSLSRGLASEVRNASPANTTDEEASTTTEECEVTYIYREPLSLTVAVVVPLMRLPLHACMHVIDAWRTRISARADWHGLVSVVESSRLGSLSLQNGPDAV